ncbi:MAG: hypothetical protein Q7S81_01130 [bacterium]|nr:hypothetical protein [bacterium]
MEDIKNISREYIKTLNSRAKQSKVYKEFQSTGLMLAEILDDSEHKAIYIRLCKIYDNQELIRRARDVAERQNVKNRGAYFMKILKDVRKLEREKFTYKTKKKKTVKLKLDI